MLRAIIFDFNGVILESTDVNTRIYGQIFSKYGQEVSRKVMVHYNENGGIPRQKRIELYLKEFARVQPTDAEIERISREFSRLYLLSLKQIPLVPGIKEFLQGRGRSYDKFISSGAPVEDLEKMLEVIGLKTYFLELYGSPQSKSHHIAEILRKYKYRPSEVAFIGDSPKDRDAAAANNVIFIVRDRGLKQLENEKYRIKDFMNINHISFF